MLRLHSRAGTPRGRPCTLIVLGFAVALPSPFRVLVPVLACSGLFRVALFFPASIWTFLSGPLPIPVVSPVAFGYGALRPVPAQACGCEQDAPLLCVDDGNGTAVWALGAEPELAPLGTLLPAVQADLGCAQTSPGTWVFDTHFAQTGRSEYSRAWLPMLQPVTYGEVGCLFFVCS